MDCRACNILKQLYFYCTTLNDTIKDLCPECVLIRNEDTDAYITFCHTTVVASPTIPDGHFAVFQGRSQLEVLHGVIENVCRNASSNVLSLGYQQLRSNRGLLVAGTKSIESYYPNSIVTYVNGHIWQKLLSRIGDDMMIYLLQNCSLFVKLDHGCLMQVTGPPIGSVFSSASLPFKYKPKCYFKPFHAVKKRKRVVDKTKHEEDAIATDGVKKCKLDCGDRDSVATGTTLSCCANSDDVLVHPEVLETSECYATAAEPCDAGQDKCPENKPAVLGGRKRKRLNDDLVISRKRLKIGFIKSTMTTSGKKMIKRRAQRAKKTTSQDVFIHRSKLFYDQNHKENFPDSSHVLSKVKCSRRGAKKLINEVFQAKRLAGDWSAFQQRQQNISHIKITTPPRLVKLIPDFQALLANHQNTDYRIKLNYHCPLSQKFYTKLSDGELKDYNTYDKLVGCYSTHSKVGNFVISVIDQVVPDVFWGSKHNRIIFCKHIRKFIKLGRYERFSLQQVLLNMKLSQCDWLKIKKSSWKQITDSIKQKQLFSQWVMWLMDEFVVRMLKGFFYVTESSNHRNRIFYYRKVVWKRIKQLALKDMTRMMLTRIEEKEVKELVEQKMTVGVAKIRLLPRVGGVRLIANMGSHLNLPFVQATSTSKQEHSVNTKLQNLFHILNYERMNHREALGHSAFGANDIYNALQPFITQLSKEDRTEPLFFISVDISCCYDSIIQSKIYDIMKSIIREDEYTIRRYVTVMVSRNRIRRSYKRSATVPGDLTSFPEFANQLISNGCLRNAIISDQVVYPFEGKENILRTLKKHMFQNIVKFDGRYYRQTQGIPQGSILSSLLCNYYYATMERQCLPTIVPSESIMLRLADDFLLITKSGSVAAQFHDRMTQGIPEYNCFINVSKTVKNFELFEDKEAEVMSDGPQWLPWCGYLINTVSLEVRIDYSRYLFTELRDAVTIHLYRKPLHHMQQVLMNTIHNKCHPLLLSHEINSSETIITNIYQLFLLSAMKFHIYMKEIHTKRLTQSLVDFQFGTIVKLSQYFHKLSKSICGKAPMSSISYSSCQWLCLHAYLKTLSKKQSNYLPLLHLISKASRRVSFILPLSQKSKLQEIVKGITLRIIF